MNEIEKKILLARKKLIEIHYKAQSPHLGGSLSCIDFLVLLYFKYLNQNNEFLMSKGHSASALFATLWALGFIDDNGIETYYSEGTKFACHTSYDPAINIAFSTGSLGHGLPLAAGMALGSKMQVLGKTIYCLCSDGEFQEGSMWEAIIFSAHHRLNNLRIIVDVNGWQGFDSTKAVASMDVSGLERRLASFNINVDVADGHNIDDLEAFLDLPSDLSRPRALLMKTCKGKGVPGFENEFISHYGKLTSEQYENALNLLRSVE